ncbi:MAG: hypothetical protein EPO11_04265 [Gammaproteobacteria bacterium]|nr:MAG: hypothetical protein EPO11_04265 [Gammaproteobacteria bacterium]
MSVDKKSIYVVLGMARSGTSAITRGLKALGIHLGDEHSDSVNQWNPTGIWEDKDIVYQINRGVAQALGDTWMSVHLLDELCRDNEKLNELHWQAVQLLTERMKEVSSWAFKDPRTSRILPFWQNVFQGLKVDENYIIALRNPLAVATSWQKVSGAEIEVGLLQWLNHLIPAIEGTQGKKRVVVSYDLMLANPRLQLERIQQQLFISSLANAEDINNYAQQYLDKKLHHYEYTEEDLLLHPAAAITPVCANLYTLLMQVAKDEITLESAEFSSAWRQVKGEYSAAYPFYLYMNRLLKRNKELERDLRTIRRSLSWKLAYPLRLINDVWRAGRKKSYGP